MAHRNSELEMVQPLPDYYLLRVKDVMNLTGTKKHAATQLLQDVRDWLTEKRGRVQQTVLFMHFRHYFALQ